MNIEYRSKWAIVSLLAALAAAGCGDDDGPAPTADLGVRDGGNTDAGDDGGGGGDDASVDMPAITGPCIGMADGAVCDIGGGVEQVCIDALCVPSVCGDGATDTRLGEDCDDGNTTFNDGCEPATCTFSCSVADDCLDGVSCNGVETCDAANHICEAGTAPAPASVCTLDSGSAGECTSGGVCAPLGCGNGVTGGDEDCDDMNAVEGDGCDSDCTFSCAVDADCAGADLCSGTATCVIATHACSARTTVDCDDESACTVDSCAPSIGCRNFLMDADFDGAAPSSAGACGTDCDDTDDTVYGGAEELCDGQDNDCDSMIDESPPTWYVDCDGDGFAANTTGSVSSCTMPSIAMSGCPRGSGGWTSTQPSATINTDCYDANALVKPTQLVYQMSAAAGRPAASDFDYDCDTSEEQLYANAQSSTALPGRCSALIGGACLGATYWVVDGARLPVAPACGVSGSLSMCALSRLGSCARSTRPTTQRCL